MKRKTEKNKADGKRVLLIILCVFLAFVLVALILVAIAQSYLALINRDVNNEQLSDEEYQQMLDEEMVTGTGTVIDPDDVTWGDQNIEQSKHVFNIMLIGQDRRAGESRQRSDAMILCTINTKDKTLTMTSFMRDLYVQIPGYSPYKMNACYQLGGMELLDSCLMANFGVSVNGNVEVDFGGFMELIDLVGGVDIELRQAEANYLNRNGNWDVNDSSAGTWNLTEGVNHLTGEQALAYSRIRYIGNGDFERTERQQKVITALLEQCRHLSIPQLNNLLQKALPMLTTDLTDMEIINYAVKVFRILPDLQVKKQRVPADNTWEYAIIRNLDVVHIIDMQTNMDMLKETMEDD